MQILQNVQQRFASHKLDGVAGTLEILALSAISYLDCEKSIH